MTPFQIQWTFLRLPPAWSEEKIRLIKRLYFEDAAKRWGYVVKGWPARVTDGGPLQLPGERPFTAIEIQVNFDYFSWDLKEDVVARVPASSLQRLKPSKAQPWNFPFLAALNVDMNDLKELENDPARFLDTIVHEIGHVLGLGTIWEDEVLDREALMRKDAKGNYFYLGEHASRAYSALKKTRPAPIALDWAGPEDSRSFHWSETDLAHEIMSTSLDSPSVATGSNAISTISIGALEDLGYSVAPGAAEPLALASGAAREKAKEPEPGEAASRTAPAAGRTLSWSRSSSPV